MVSSSTPTRKQTQNQLTKKEKKNIIKKLSKITKTNILKNLKKKKEKNTHPHAATITYTKNENNIS